MTSPQLSTHTQILNTATALFLQHGYHGLSMRELARRVGVSKASLYYHFNDKEQLFLAILNNNVEQMAEVVANARRHPSTRQQISSMLQQLARQAPQQYAIIRLASQELGHLSPEARQSFIEHYHNRFILPISEMLQSGIERGELKNMNAQQATWLLLGMMYPFLYPQHGSSQASLAEALDLIVEIFFEGAAA